jgi:hypothetical protein
MENSTKSGSIDTTRVTGTWPKKQKKREEKEENGSKSRED